MAGGGVVVEEGDGVGGRWGIGYWRLGIRWWGWSGGKSGCRDLFVALFPGLTWGGGTISISG